MTARLRNGIRIYGAWAGNPNGTPENLTRCIEEVRTGQPGDFGHQCPRKRGHGPDGLHCKQHSPEAEQLRGATRDRNYALYTLTYRISSQRLTVSEAARNVFKQAATMDQLEAAVAELERLIAEKETL